MPPGPVALPHAQGRGGGNAWVGRPVLPEGRDTREGGTRPGVPVGHGGPSRAPLGPVQSPPRPDRPPPLPCTQHPGISVQDQLQRRGRPHRPPQLPRQLRGPGRAPAVSRPRRPGSGLCCWCRVSLLAKAAAGPRRRPAACRPGLRAEAGGGRQGQRATTEAGPGDPHSAGRSEGPEGGGGGPLCKLLEQGEAVPGVGDGLDRGPGMAGVAGFSSRFSAEVTRPTPVRTCRFG